MSTAPASGPGLPPPGTSPRDREIKLISHSNLFYWWPVWLLAFVMAIWTWVEDHRMAILPPGGVVTKKEAGVYEMRFKDSKGVARTTKSLDDAERRAGSSEPAFTPRVSQSAVPGAIFVVGLLVTIFVTNVPLRGLWTFISLALIVVVALLISLFHVWDDIFEALGRLHIHINMAGFLVIGTVVFVLWALATWVFDQRSYIIFTPGQIRVCEHIGDSVQTFPTLGVSMEKLRDDIFRHYILGFGSGDLIVRVSGAERKEIRMPNVLGIGWRLKAVEDVLASVKTT
jgi:hypothetical protein